MSSCIPSYKTDFSVKRTDSWDFSRGGLNIKLNWRIFRTTRWEETTPLGSLLNLVCLLEFKTDKSESRSLSQLEAYGRVSRDFTDHIDTDKEKLSFTPLIRMPPDNHVSDKSRHLRHLSRHHVNVITNCDTTIETKPTCQFFSTTT